MWQILWLLLVGAARAHIPWLDAPDLVACATARLRFDGPDGSGPPFLVTVRTLSDGVDPSVAPALFSFPPANDTLDWPVALPAGTRVSFEVCNAAGEFADWCSFGSVRTVQPGFDSTCLGAEGRGLASASAPAAVRLSSSISALEGVARATPTAAPSVSSVISAISASLSSAASVAAGFNSSTSLRRDQLSTLAAQTSRPVSLASPSTRLGSSSSAANGSDPSGGASASNGGGGISRTASIIVGSVVGGVAGLSLLCLLALCCCCRRRRRLRPGATEAGPWSGYNPAWPYLSLPSGVPPPKAMGFVAAQSASEKASEWIGTKLRSGSKRLAYRAAV